MTEFYPQIKLVHVAAVVASGPLFLMRGRLVQADRPLAMAAPVRFLSYSIDTVLLAAAVMLLGIVLAAAYANGWLAAKLALLVIYVGLGTVALKRGRTLRTRLACFVAALAVYVSMLAIARTDHPLDPIQMLLTG